MSKARDYKQQPINVMDINEMILMSDLFPRVTEKLVALRILKYDGHEKGATSFSQKYLAEKMNISHESVRRTLVRMELLQLVKRTKSQGGTTEVAINWKLWRAKFHDWSVNGSATSHTRGDPAPSTSHMREEHFPHQSVSEPPTSHTSGDKEHYPVDILPTKRTLKDTPDIFSGAEKASEDFEEGDEKNQSLSANAPRSNQVQKEMGSFVSRLSAKSRARGERIEKAKRWIEQNSSR